MSTVSILKALVAGGMSPVGACAMGGNMMAESGMVSNIAQRGMTKLTDEQYTAAADMGTIDFVHDGVGYGLVQLTYHTRKQNFLNFAKSIGASVGNESAQVKFVLKELQVDYPVLWSYLQYADNLYDAASRICAEYERPAVNNIDKRASFALELLQRYFDILNAIPEEPSQSASGQLSKRESQETETSGYILAAVRFGEHTPEAEYLRALLENKGYDVLWLGLDACLRDYQQKNGFTVDGVCGEMTWEALRG